MENSGGKPVKGLMDDRNSNYGTVLREDDSEYGDEVQSEENNYDEKDLLISHDTESEKDGECANDGQNEEDNYDENDLLISRSSASYGEQSRLGDRKLEGNNTLGLDVNADDDPYLDSLKSDEEQLNVNEEEDNAEIGGLDSYSVDDSAEEMAEMTSSSEPVQVDATLRDEETSDCNYLPSNPFGDDDNDDSCDHDTPVNLTDGGVQTSNPFGDDDDDDEDEDGPEMKEDIKRNTQKVPPVKPAKVKKPFNPFDDGEIEGVGSVAVERILLRRKAVTESLAPVTVASVCNGRATSPSLSQFEVPSKKYSKEYHELMALGFDRVCVGNALQKSSGDVAIATKMLTSRLFDDRVMSNDQLYVWKSPLLLRVGE